MKQNLLTSSPKYLKTALAVLISSAIASHASKTNATESNIKKFEKIEVSETAVNAEFKTDKVSSDKFTQPLLDTPQTIVVVKKELFQQQAVTTLSETLRNTPGITLLMGENGNTATGDSLFMRGFDTQGSIFVDGIRDLGTISRDTFNTEQVEIAKGPAGADNGRGSASGYVNLVTKTATAEDYISGNLTLGSADYKRSTLDVNRKLSDSTAVRLNVLAQKAGVDGRDQIENNLTGVAGSLVFGLNSETRTTLNLLHVEQRNLPDGGMTTAGMEGYYSSTYASAFPTGGPDIIKLDSENFYGALTDKNDVDLNMFTLKIEKDISSDLTFRNTSRFGRSTQALELTGVNGLVIPTDTKNDLSTWQVARTRQGKNQTSQILANQSNLKATFSIADIKNELVSGVEFMVESQSTQTLGLPWSSSTSTTRLTQANANLYAPSTTDTFQPLVSDGTKIDGSTTTGAIYLVDTLTLHPQWELTLGVRAEHYYADTDQITRQGAVTAPATQAVAIGTLLGKEASDSDTLLSWKLGTVYKPTEKGSIYVSYATSQLPPGSANYSSQGAFALNTDTASLSANSPTLDSQEGENVEVGTKWNFYKDRLAFTAAIFKSSNTNELVTQPDFTYAQIGEREVEGIEFGLVGIVKQNWQLSAGLAVMDPKIVTGSSGSTASNYTSLNGGTIQWSPKVTFTLWNSYVWKNGFVIGGGARYVDSMLTSSITDPTRLATRSMVEVPEYWVYDAMASYPLNKNVQLQLNIYNLANEEYIASINSGGSRYYPGVPLSGRLGMTFTF